MSRNNTLSIAAIQYKFNAPDNDSAKDIMALLNRAKLSLCDKPFKWKWVSYEDETFIVEGKLTKPQSFNQHMFDTISFMFERYGISVNRVLPSVTMALCEVQQTSGEEVAEKVMVTKIADPEVRATYNRICNKLGPNICPPLDPTIPLANQYAYTQWQKEEKRRKAMAQERVDKKRKAK